MSLTGIIFSVLLVKVMKNNISVVYKSITFILAMLSQLFLIDFGPRATWENMPEGTLLVPHDENHANQCFSTVYSFKCFTMKALLQNEVSVVSCSVVEKLEGF